VAHLLVQLFEATDGALKRMTLGDLAAPRAKSTAKGRIGQQDK
jgi:hypothetical protein